jgi:hypothetical protein
MAIALAGCAEQRKEAITPPLPHPAAKVPPRPSPGALDDKPREPLLLSPALAEDQKDKVEREVTTKIQQAEQRIAKIDQKQLTTQQNETLLTIQSFLSKAKEALSQKDVPRALTLADKAQTLAQELPDTPGK